MIVLNVEEKLVVRQFHAREYKDDKRIKGKMTYPDGKIEEGNWDGEKFLGKY